MQLFSATKCLAGRYRPTANRLGVIGNGGGPGVLAADHAFLRGIDIPSLSIATVEQLRAKLPLAPSLENPIDIGEHATAEDFVAAVETLAASPDVDGVLVVMTPKPGIDTEAIARRTRRLKVCQFSRWWSSDMDESSMWEWPPMNCSGR